MAEPSERRREDELVEPLYAGLRDADEAPAAGAPDPWTQGARGEGQDEELDQEAEPSNLGLFFKALLVLIGLLGLSTAVYFVFGV